MNHEEKLRYLRMALGLAGFHLKPKDMDMMVSMYELVMEKKGETDLNSMVDVQFAVEEREKTRLMKEYEEKLETQTKNKI